MQYNLLRSYRIFPFLAILLLTSSLLLAACGEQDKVYTLGVYLDNTTQASRIDGLKDGLKALGYQEGKNLKIDLVDGSKLSNEQLKSAFKDLFDKNYDAYWATNGSAAELLKQQGYTRQPIVVAGFAEPVARGLIQSPERPGTNMTGVDSINVDLTLKRLGWLLKYDPTISKVYLLYDPNNQSQTSYLEKLRAEASRLKLTLLEKTLSSKAEAKTLLAQLKSSEAPALLTVGLAPISQFMDYNDLNNLVTREKMIVIGGDRNHIDAGALMVYGSTYYALGRQSASYVSKIFLGANPTDLPVLPPERVELVLNQKIADQLGRPFPEVVLSAADEVVK